MTKDKLTEWLAEVFWLLISEGPRLDGKPGASVLAMSPLGAIKEFRFSSEGVLEMIEEMH